MNDKLNMEKVMYNNKKIYCGILFFILLYPLSLILYPCQAHAEGISLGIYPPIIQIQAKAPADIQSPMTLTNESDTPVDVQIGVRPFTQNTNNNGQPQYLAPGQRVGDDPLIFQKMSLFDGTQNTNHLTLAPHQKKNIELRIHLPSGEPPGDYYFSIIFISKAIATDHQTGTAVAGGVSTNVLLSIGPRDVTRGYIQQFSVPLFLDSGPVPFTLLVLNTSKHFITPQGTIIVKNMYGQIIGKVNLRQDTIILAGTSRYLPDDQSQSSQPKADRSLDELGTHPIVIWPEKFLLGPYSATLTLALSGEGPLYRQTIYFFALPIQILIGSILGIILVTIVVYRVKQRLAH